MVEPRAANDIEAAYQWIATRAPENAVKWFNGLSEALATLEHFPERCPHAPEVDFFEIEIRQPFYAKRIGRYRILFTIERDNVHILHVRHGARKQLHEPEDTEPD